MRCCRGARGCRAGVLRDACARCAVGIVVHLGGVSCLTLLRRLPRSCCRSPQSSGQPSAPARVGLSPGASHSTHRQAGSRSPHSQTVRGHVRLRGHRHGCWGARSSCGPVTSGLPASRRGGCQCLFQCGHRRRHSGSCCWWAVVASGAWPQRCGCWASSRRWPSRGIAGASGRLPGVPAFLCARMPAELRRELAQQRATVLHHSRMINWHPRAYWPERL